MLEIGRAEAVAGLPFVMLVFCSEASLRSKRALHDAVFPLCSRARARR